MSATKRKSSVRVLGSTKRKKSIWPEGVTPRSLKEQGLFAHIRINELERRVESLEGFAQDYAPEHTGDGFSGGRPLKAGLWARAIAWLQPKS